MITRMKERHSSVYLLLIKPKAISNGELVSLVENKDNTHTFHWRENFPMVSYLISFVIGDYVKVEDNYKDIPVAYWVYPENEKEAFRSLERHLIC